MASSYAALRSLKCTLETLKNLTRFPISIDKKQIKSLQEKVDFLIDFLETFSHGGNGKAQDLENRMADAAYNTEDAIESHVADEITGETANGFDLECFIEDLDLIKSESMEMKRMSAVENMKSNSSPPINLPSPTPIRKITTVGFEDEFRSIKNKLTGHKSSLLIIPIVGMGGIGKTTLAKSVYEDELIVHYFDIRVWVTISQVYDMKRILAEVLSCIGKYQTGGEISENELGERIYKSLFGRRYLVVIDDMWEIDPWNRLRIFFPREGKGSGIIVTTRNSHLDHQFGNYAYRLKLLDDDKSWNLFCKEVFGEKSCREELEEVGKKIVKNCKGLPLSIIVIGGLLAKSAKTKDHWEYIANSMNAANLEHDEPIIKILSLSYHSLPIHLKPCFLYMGVFREDKLIRSSKVIQLWIAEGFLKPVTDVDLEVVGKAYLSELLSRNLLVFISNEWPDGDISFKIHDIIRDLCLRECQSPTFLYVQSYEKLGTQQGMKTHRRIIIHPDASKVEYGRQIVNTAESSCLRSLRCHDQYSDNVFALGNPKLLRIFDVDRKGWCSTKDIVRLVNCRYVSLYIKVTSTHTRFPSPQNLMLKKMWNLQFLQIKGHRPTSKFVAPPEIWKMTQLRHVDVSEICLPEPPKGKTDMDDKFVLENLHTLSKVSNFRCTENVVKRIPNIRKLVITGEFEEYNFKNIGRLSKLESLDCSFSSVLTLSGTIFQSFPISLKDLTLEQFEFGWEDLTYIGSLPYLEVLKLGSFKCTPVWEPIYGEFSRLKSLQFYKCDLVEWIADRTHFPCLEHLHFSYLNKLEEIPIDIGEIPTLQSIELHCCSKSSIHSAKAMLDYLEGWRVGPQIYVTCYENEELKSSLTNNNFIIHWESEEYESDMGEDEGDVEDDIMRGKMMTMNQ